MARKIAVIVALVATIFIVGCAGGADPAKQAVGKWKMDIDTSAMAEKDKAGVEMAKGFLSAITIEVKEGGKAAMSAMGTTKEGTWKVEGTKITISGFGSTPGADTDMVGTISSDGKSIALEAPKGQADQMKGAKISLKKEEAAATEKK